MTAVAHHIPAVKSHPIVNRPPGGNRHGGQFPKCFSDGVEHSGQGRFIVARVTAAQPIVFSRNERPLVTAHMIANTGRRVILRRMDHDRFRIQSKLFLSPPAHFIRPRRVDCQDIHRNDAIALAGLFQHKRARINRLLNTRAGPFPADVTGDLNS